MSNRAERRRQALELAKSEKKAAKSSKQPTQSSSAGASGSSSSNSASIAMQQKVFSDKNEIQGTLLIASNLITAR